MSPIAVAAVVLLFSTMMRLGVLSLASPSFYPPLTTKGNQIVDSRGAPVKLACVNWYGMDEKDFTFGGLNLQTYEDIIASIDGLGFNCIRLPWAVQMVLSNPNVQQYAVTANPSFENEPALSILDTIVSALNASAIGIILDNHMSNSDWCCNTQDQNGLWYNDDYPVSSWSASWQAMVNRYSKFEYVIGTDLRNELRSSTISGKTINPTWGSGDISSDWHLAATTMGNTILSLNPNLLVIVEGLNYDLDLTGAKNTPIILDYSNQLVYEAHDYSFDYPITTYAAFKTILDASFGFLIPDHPVWLGEFGTCHTNLNCVKDAGENSAGRWFQFLRRYLAENNLSWSYWAIDGTQSSGTGRTFGAEETYGILNTTWNGVALEEHFAVLQSIQSSLSTSAQLCDYVPGDFSSGDLYVYVYCDPGQVINGIKFASYGVPSGSCGSFVAGSCNANSTLNVVSKACLNQSECSIEASSQVFGDPCPGTDKLLALEVSCGPALDSPPF